MKLSVGTSGYSYKEWKGSFYPEKLPAKDMLRFYAEKLPAVEINNTFYRLPRESVRDISESVMRQEIGDFSVSEALTTRKNEINLSVKQKLQKILDYYQSGIQIVKLELQEVLPPEVVKRSFNEVNEAEQEREKVINQSWEAYNKVIPRARGQAEKTIKDFGDWLKVNRLQWYGRIHPMTREHHVTLMRFGRTVAFGSDLDLDKAILEATNSYVMQTDQPRA